MISPIMRVKTDLVRLFLLHCVLSLVGFAGESAGAADKSAFWERPALREKMENQRAILVAAQVEDGVQGKILSVEGAGYVRRSSASSFALLRQFSRWKEMSSLIERSDYVEKLSVLNLEFRALGTSIFLPLKVTVDEKSSKKFQFQVLEGVFKGMRVDLNLKDYKRRETEISMTARGEIDKLPGPKFAVEFGAEVALRQMAESMRLYIESSAHERPAPPAVTSSQGE